MKLLRPAPTKQQYWKDVEKDIQGIFDSIYIELFALTKEEQELYNSIDPISNAILEAQIGYSNGSFFGAFSSTLTKELRLIGAKYDGKSKTWKLPATKVPVHIKSAIVQRQGLDSVLNKRVLSAIDNIDVNKVISDSSLLTTYEKSIQKMASDIDKTIGVKITLTEAQRDIIAKEWTENLELYIKNFLDKNIKQLREDVYTNTIRGQRAENLVKSIQSRYSVSKNKAKFLARQETSLLTSKMRETRYKDAGINKYKWSSSNDSRVRPMHNDLDGKIISWDSPPIVDEKGRRAHPGEDFNCRCLAIPIIE